MSDVLVALRNFQSAGLLPDPRGAVVWDLGCGHGRFTDAFLRIGAARVIATDLLIDRARLMPGLLDHPRVSLCEGDFDAAVRTVGESGKIPADLVFMSLMTEHVLNLRRFFRRLSDVVRPGTQVFLEHDNYYQPTGHHDHAFLFLNEATWHIEPQGVACWTLPERCYASEQHRVKVRASWPHLWSDASEATRNPQDCSSCNYFRRSQPWAHLTYAQDWRRTFPEPWFARMVNRATTHQVRWFMEEAGFVIMREKRSWIQNPVPQGLAELFGRHELSTFTMLLRARSSA